MEHLLKSTKHSVPSEILFAYAIGDLDPGISLLVGCHSALNADAARAIALHEAVGGSLLETLDADAMADGSLEAILSRLDEPEKEVALDGPVSAEFAGLPDPVRAIADRQCRRGGWRFAAPGVRTMDLSPAKELEHASVEVQLLKLDPGKGTPRHGHAGSELTLVLTGAFKDETGRYGPGDLSIGTPELTHRPIAEPGESCIALAVTDAPLEFTGALGTVQRLLRRASIID